MTSSIYLPKWNEVLVALYRAPDYRRYCQKINHQVESSANHIREIVKQLTKKKLIEIFATKKIKRIFVTDKGKRVAISILDIMSELR